MSLSHHSKLCFFSALSLITNSFVCSCLQVSLLTDSGGTKDDLKLPTDDSLSALVNILSFLTYLCEEFIEFIFVIRR